jgi:hypothetical protein
MMSKPGVPESKRFLWLLLSLYLLLDLLATALGMGVPFFNILLGFPTGWVLARRLSKAEQGRPLRTIWRGAWLTSAFTFLLMAAIWLPQLPNLFNPSFEYAKSGVPFWLYDPQLSYIGWLALMVLVSPFLQLLATVSASFAALLHEETQKNRQCGSRRT